MQLLLHPSDQPVFRLSFRAAQCAIEVRINDVPVFQDRTGSALSVEMPVNEWLFQGPNAIHWRLSPPQPDAPFGTQAGLAARLTHKFARDAVKNIAEAGKLQWQPDRRPVHEHAHGQAALEPDAYVEEDEGDDDAPLLALPGQPEELTWRHRAPVILPDKSVRIESIVTLPPPWPVCPWSRGQSLFADHRTLFVLQNLVRGLHGRLQQGQHEDVLRLRRNALETAYYLDAAEATEALALPMLLKDPNWRLQPLAEQGLDLDFAGGGRLARLLDKQTRESPIVAHHQTLGICAVFDAWWMFDGEWKLIR